MEEYRRRVDELIARYQLEPTVRDVFVEGAMDVDLVRWFVGRLGLSDVNVYEINTVHLDASTVEAAGFSGGGNRGRLLCLASELSRHIDIETQATLLADRDLDELLGTLRAFPHLLYTDFACLEMYLVEEKMLQKFLDLVAGGGSHTASEISLVLGPILIETALLRAAKANLGWPLQKIEPSSCCSAAGIVISFDPAQMVEKALIAGSRMKEAAQLQGEIDRLRSIVGADYRMVANGHDLVDLLAWYVRRIAKRSGFRTAQVHRWLLTCVEFDALRQQPMFQSLLLRLRQ